MEGHEPWETSRIGCCVQHLLKMLACPIGAGRECGKLVLTRRKIWPKNVPWRSSWRTRRSPWHCFQSTIIQIDFPRRLWRWLKWCRWAGSPRRAFWKRLEFQSLKAIFKIIPQLHFASLTPWLSKGGLSDVHYHKTPKFNNSPMKRYRIPKGKANVFQASIFRD